MLRRLSTAIYFATASGLRFTSQACSAAQVIAVSCAMSLTFAAVPSSGLAETAWESASSSAPVAVKKKKRKKRMRAARETGRTYASTGSRRLAQDDLDADLDSELDADLESGSSEASSPAIKDEPAVAEPALSASVGEDVQIQDIQYDSKKNGGTVVVSTSGAATYRTRPVPSQNQVVIEIANAKLPERLKRPFNTKDFRQSIVSINAYQDPSSNTARVVLQFRQPRTVEVQQHGKVLQIVAGGATAPSASPAAPVASSEDFGDEESAENAALADENLSAEASSEPMSSPSTTSTSYSPARARAAAASGKIMPSSSLDQERAGDVRFYGKPISLEYRDTPVRDVITMISEQSGANIILADDVQGSITIKLRQVPWDQALSIIMKTRSLGYVRQGGVLRIAPIRQLQSEAEEARRIIEAQDATLPLRVKVIPVSFANVTLLSTQIRNTLQSTTSSGGAGSAATARGKIEADPRSSSLIITDTDDNIRRIEQLVKALDTPPLQVMIEGKIVEANEKMSRNLGINWGYQGQDLGFAGGTLSHSATIAPATSGSTTVNLKLGTLDFFGDLSAKLSLLESESMAKIISSPRVITMNAQKATIEQSVNIPITTTTVTTGAPSQTSTTYRAIPTTLDVTPQITPGGDVLMQIAFRREFQAGASGANVAIESRDVKTNVMVKNGQTTVIGGIYQADQTESEEGTPYLRKIPVLGWLFKAQTKVSQKNELLVFITPRILNADRTLPKAEMIK